MPKIVPTPKDQEILVKLANRYGVGNTLLSLAEFSLEKATELDPHSKGGRYVVNAGWGKVAQSLEKLGIQISEFELSSNS